MWEPPAQMGERRRSQGQARRLNHTVPESPQGHKRRCGERTTSAQTEDHTGTSSDDNHGVQEGVRKVIADHEAQMEVLTKNTLRLTERDTGPVQYQITGSEDDVKRATVKGGGSVRTAGEIHRGKSWDELQLDEKILNKMRFVDEVDTALRCVKCEQLLQSPKQLNCGHRICTQCERETLPEKRCHNCPKITCRDEVTSSFPDNYARQEIMKLAVYCVRDQCVWTGMLRNIRKHLRESTVCTEALHYPLIANKAATKNTSRQVKGRKEDERFVQMATKFNREANNIGYQLGKNRKEIAKALEAVQDMDAKLILLKKELQALFTKSAYKEGVKDYTDSTYSTLSEISQQVAEIESKHPKFQENINRSSTEKIQKIEPDIRRIEGTHSSCSGLLRDLDLKTRLYQSSTTDGKYIWKLDRLEERIKNAREGLCSELYTPPLYASIFGYKYCLKIFLDGDQNSQVFEMMEDACAIQASLYIAIYFIRMLGDFDVILEFPLPMGYKISILDQSEKKHHKDHIPRQIRVLREAAARIGSSHRVPNVCQQGPSSELWKLYNRRRYFHRE
jgi:hypothetical protein